MADVIARLKRQREARCHLKGATHVRTVVDIDPSAPATPAGALPGVIDLLETLAPLNVGGLFSLLIIPINNRLSSRVKQGVIVLLRESVIIL